jgi:phosphatidylglycerol---prolipoprotein diacylglyceryl transferase
VYPIFFRLPEWFPFLGGEPITSFGVFMFFAFLAGGMLLRAEMERVDLPAEKAWDMLFMAVLGGVLGARIYYIFLNYPQLAVDPAGLIFSRGGMVWYGGFIGGVVMCLWEVHRSKLPRGRMADLVAAPLAVSYAVGRMGCFLVGDDYGRPTSGWWGIKFPEGTPATRVDLLERHFGITVDPAIVEQFGQVVPVHPTQLYEIAMSLVIFAVIWKIRAHKHVAGWLWWVWLGLAGTERFLVEFVRVKDDRFLGPLTIAQVISVLLIGLSIWGMNRTRKVEPAAA